MSQTTTDHILPKSRGGDTSWQNLVSSCSGCNSKKGDRTPEEAGMRPQSPSKPTFLCPEQDPSFLKNWYENLEILCREH
jgi:5-methylcytosine-specific restriction endonuclease McrA